MSQPATRTLESIVYTNKTLRVLDQRRLPLETVYDEVHTVQDIWCAIKEMRVRGAPAIAVSAALGIAVAAMEKLRRDELHSAIEAVKFLCASCDYVITSRPTAVNLHNCLSQAKQDLTNAVGEGEALSSAAAVVQRFTELAEAIHAADVSFNQGIMHHGARYIMHHRRPADAAVKHGAHDNTQLCEGLSGRNNDNTIYDDSPITDGSKVRVMTICNTGALATARYGTALGVVRQLFYDGHLERLYACETRPWNQGARLTVYECVQESIPCTLICDSAAAALMSRQHIDAVIVGADRVCQNGDTANKIGTYHLAVAARYHGVPFYVAAPSTTLDPCTASGAEVTIEEREAAEMTTNMTTKERVVADGPHLRVWNPVFDITPAELITGGIITETGVIEPAMTAPYYTIARPNKENQVRIL